MSSGLTGSCLGSPAKYTTRARLAAISSAACCACFDGAATLTRSAPSPVGARQHLLDAVVLAGDPGVVDELPDDAERELEPLAAHVGQEHPARAAVPGHDRLPAADRARPPGSPRVSPSRTSSTSMPFSAHANGSATVARSDGRSAGSGIRFFVAIGGTGRVVRVGAGERVVAVQQVVLAQVLEPLEAPTALAAREDRAEEHAVALLRPPAAARPPGPPPRAARPARGPAPTARAPSGRR